MTAALGILLTAGIVLVIWSNQRLTGMYASANRELTAVGQDRQQIADERVQATLAELVRLQGAMVKVQETVSSFQNEAIKARRFKGAQERQRVEFCARGILRGAFCENLPSEQMLDFMNQ